MKRLFAFLLMVAIVAVLHLHYGCAAPNVSRQRHTEATVALDTLVNEYMIEYRKSDFYTQVYWRYRIDPEIKKARIGLFSWENAIAVKEYNIAKEKERYFLIAKDRLMFILIKEEVME